MRQRALGVVARRARELRDRQFALPPLPVFHALVERAPPALREEIPRARSDSRDYENDENGDPPWSSLSWKRHRLWRATERRRSQPFCRHRLAASRRRRFRRRRRHERCLEFEKSLA